MPTGMTMNSWKSVESAACLPPFRMLNIGTGSVRGPCTTEIAVERQVVRGRRGVRARQRDTEDRVRAELALVGRAVELDEQLVDRGLVARRPGRGAPAR